MRRQFQQISPRVPNLESIALTFTRFEDSLVRTWLVYRRMRVKSVGGLALGTKTKK